MKLPSWLILALAYVLDYWWLIAPVILIVAAYKLGFVVGRDAGRRDVLGGKR